MPQETWIRQLPRVTAVALACATFLAAQLHMANSEGLAGRLEDCLRVEAADDMLQAVNGAPQQAHLCLQLAGSRY
jgi:hypothetical protein